jgi:tetratricopeptide (TPR) repeat protein
MDEARTRFDKSEAAARDLDDKRLLSEALRNLSALELANAEAERARDLAQRAFELADGAGIRVDVGRALIALGEIHAQTLFHDQGGGAEDAEDYFRRAVDLFREIGNEAELGVALERFGAWRVERGDFAGGKLLLAEAQGIFTRLGMKAFGAAAQRMMTELE